MFRFFDDLHGINDRGEFENNFKGVYLLELQHNKEISDNLEAFF